MKKQKVALGRVLKIGLIYLTFVLTVYLMVRAFIVLKAYSWYQTVVSYATIDREAGYFYEEYAEERFKLDRLTTKRLDFEDQFYDYDNMEWIEENCGDYPGYVENGLSYVKYHGELYRGIYGDRNGCYTWQIEDYPLAITATTSKSLITAIRLLSILFLITLAIASRSIYTGWENALVRKNTTILLSGLSRDLTGHIGRLHELVSRWQTAGEEEKNVCSGAVIEEVDRLDEVIRRQMKVKDIANGNIDLHPEEIDLYYVTERLVEKIGPTLGNQRILFKRNRSGNCIVLADPDIMKMVIGNMIRLASEETEGDIEIQIIPWTSGMIEFNIKTLKHLIAYDRVKKIWYMESHYDKARVKDFGSEGCSWAAVGQMLRTERFPHGCSQGEAGSEFWFKVKGVQTES